MAKLIIVAILLIVSFSFFYSHQDSSPAVKKPSEPQEQIAPVDLKPVTAEKLLQIISSYQNQKAVLVNFWATWCGPCVAEFPDLVKIKRKYPEKLKVLFVSFDFLDQENKVRNFLKKQGVTKDVYLKSEDDQDFLKKMPAEWSGSLPLTMIFDTKGQRIATLEGKQSLTTLDKIIKLELDKN